MKRTQPVRVTYRNGAVTTHEVDMFNLYSLLSTLDMDKVSGIEYGEAILHKTPVVVRPSGFDYSYDKGEGVYNLNVFDTDDRKVAVAKFEPVKLQQFALNMLQQTTYRFTDTQAEKDELQFRMDGLDK